MSHRMRRKMPTAGRWAVAALVVTGLAGCDRSPAPSSGVAASPGGLAPERASLSGQRRVEPVPVRRGRPRGRDRLRPRLGHDRGRSTSPPPTARAWPSSTTTATASSTSTSPPARSCPSGPPETGPNRLYRNLGDGTFQDVTEASGLGFAGFCHGIVVGDIDNDGDPDVFLCNYGPNVLYLNNGDGTFRDISHAAGIDRPGWSSGGAFLDYDNDGDLDLYVANYGDWKLPRGRPLLRRRREEGPALLLAPDDPDDQAHPLPQQRRPDLHRRRPTPAGRSAASDGHGFGVVAADLNGDGQIDLYVANDMNPNFLFLNKGDGTFEDATEISGAGLDEQGQAQSGMGVDAEDVDGDGLPELFVTNFDNEYNTLYLNLGQGAVPRRDGPSSAWPPTRSLGRLGLRPGRLRQRRLARLLRRQRPRRRQPPRARPAGRLRGAAPLLFAQPRRASGSAWRPATPAPTSTPSTSAGARRSATSTTTATSTSSSTTRTAPRRCSATTRKNRQPLDPPRAARDAEQPRRRRRPRRGRPSAAGPSTASARGVQHGVVERPPAADRRRRRRRGRLG